MKVEQKIIQAVIKANTELRSDVYTLLKGAYLKEKNKKAKQALGVILENAKIARRRRLAICQDTGLAVVFLRVGRDVMLTAAIMEKIQCGVTAGYKQGGFRASAIDADGELRFNPDIFHVEFAQSKGLGVTVFPKGFGSENKSRLEMFNPTAGDEDIDTFVVNAVRDAGPSACPPFFVGVGIGGTADTSLILAKKALLEKMNVPNKDRRIYQWETRLYRKINALAIGPMGLGGKFTCLAVKIKTHPTHIAGLPVGVNVSCHALRSASVHFDKNELGT